MAFPLIPVLIGAAALIFATRKTGRAIPAVHRDPLPDLEVIAEFHPDTVAEIINECLATLPMPEGGLDEWSGAELEAIELELAACIGEMAYPEISWPAVAGDHPSIELVWQKLLVLATESIAQTRGAIVEPGQPIPPIPRGLGE